jgi:diguanylate cyclase (GGDEF)-like protein
VHFLFAGSILDAILLTVAVFDVIRRELHEKEAALAREKYYIDLSRTDALTGLYNRRHLSETVKRMETERSMPIVTTLIMIDIDNFKVINDTYGHQVGDSILAAVGKHIRGRIRKSDIACRYGGDEFLLILPGGGQESAMRICEGIKEDLQENDFRSESGERVVVTLSVGITESRLEDSFDGMFLRADAALYQAKKTGRARVAVL